MAKLEWMENGRPKSRKFDLLVVQESSGIAREYPFAGRIILGRQGSSRVLRVIRPPLEVRPVRRNHWRPTMLILFGVWITQMLHLLF